MHLDLLLTDARLHPAPAGGAVAGHAGPAAGPPAADATPGPVGEDDPGKPDALGIRDGRIAWIGKTTDVRASHSNPGDLAGGAPTAERVESVHGRLLTPALVDCHTHLVFAGERSDEWARRLAGESYADIARGGGGIMATVAATRAATLEDLAESAAARLRTLAAGGVGTVEIKSGYGLDVETELRMLEAARRAGEMAGVRVTRTLLAAHAVPPVYGDGHDRYLDEVVLPLVRRCGDEGLAEAVDAFCESIAFTPAQVRRVFEAAREAGLPVKLHADQLENGGGAALAAEFGALSADHLEHTDAGGVLAMATAGTTAVLLPGAWLHLGGGTTPPVAALRAAGVPMAVATDANPGTSPLLSLLTAAHVACTAFGLSIDEVFAGITSRAARALGRAGEFGSLEVGARADLAIWKADSPARLVQWIGDRPLHRRMMEGRWV